MCIFCLWKELDIHISILVIDCIFIVKNDVASNTNLNIRFWNHNQKINAFNSEIAYLKCVIIYDYVTYYPN